MRGWMILACCGLSALACADEGQLLLDQRALLLNDSRLPREAALDRLTREVAAVGGMDEAGAQKKVETFLTARAA